jgi:CDGSH-type Zn-finger protein
MTRRPMPLDGPQIVRGVGFVVDTDGEATATRRPAVALCRCEASARRPWCDGTHKLLARHA